MEKMGYAVDKDSARGLGTPVCRPSPPISLSQSSVDRQFVAPAVIAVAGRRKITGFDEVAERLFGVRRRHVLDCEIAQPRRFGLDPHLAAIDEAGAGSGSPPGWKRIPLAEAGLMPVGVNPWRGAGLIQFRDLFGREVPADGAQVVAELVLVARADDEGGDGGALQQPVEGDLRDGLAGFGGYLVQGIHHFEQMFFRDLGPQTGGDGTL